MNQKLLKFISYRKKKKVKNILKLISGRNLCVAVLDMNTLSKDQNQLLKTIRLTSSTHVKNSHFRVQNRSSFQFRYLEQFSYKSQGFGRALGAVDKKGTKKVGMVSLYKYHHHVAPRTAGHAPGRHSGRKWHVPSSSGDYRWYTDQLREVTLTIM